MATTFQRLFASERSLEPRQFTVQTETCRPALSCPACSLVFDLPLGIDLGHNGETSLQVPCPAPRCSWQDWCVLDGIWEP
jgi:hypothetical protein